MPTAEEIYNEKGPQFIGRLKELLDEKLISREDAEINLGIRKGTPKVQIHKTGGLPIVTGLPPAALKPDNTFVQDVEKLTEDLWKEPLGAGRKTLGPLANQTQQEADTIPGLVRTFTGALASGGSIAVDAAIRGVQEVIGTVGLAIGHAAEATGLTQTIADVAGDGVKPSTKTFLRDFMSVSEIAGIVTGSHPLTVGEMVSKFRSAAGRSASAAAASQGIQKVEQVSKHIEDAAEAATEAAMNRVGMQELIPPSRVPLFEEERLNPDVQKRLLNSFKEEGIDTSDFNPENELVSDYIMRVVKEGRLSEGSELSSILERANMPLGEFAAIFRMDARKAGQTLQRLSTFRKRLDKLAQGIDDPKVAEEFKQVFSKSAWDSDARWLAYLKRADNLRRIIMVSRPATAARNAVVAGGRAGLDVVQDAIDISIQKMFRINDRELSTPTQSFANTMTFLAEQGSGRTQKLLDAVFEGFPDIESELFTRFASDLSPVENRLVNGALYFNRMQEFLFRRAKFAATVDRRLNARGSSLEEVVRLNKVHELDGDLVRDALNESLDFTFAAAPKSVPVKNMVDTVLSLPFIGTAAIPYPRFLANAIRFNYEYSPLPLTKLLFSKTEWAKIQKGDTSTISKGIIGTGLYYTAANIRDSEFAGPEWYQIKLPEGESDGRDRFLDVRAFAPFSTYLFVADLAKRVDDQTIGDLTWRDLVKNIAGLNMQRGQVPDAVEDIVTDIIGLKSQGEAGWRKVTTAISEIGAGYLTPGKSVSNILAGTADLAAQQIEAGAEKLPERRLARKLLELSKALRDFSQDERTMKETRDVEMTFNLAPMIEKIPGLRQGLPDRQDALREDPTRTQNPLSEEFPGLRVESPIGKGPQELAKFGYSSLSYSMTTPDPLFNRFYRENLGVYFDKTLSTFVRSSKYLRASKEDKDIMLREHISGARSWSSAKALKRLYSLGGEHRMRAVQKVVRDNLNRQEEIKVFGREL